MSRKDYRWAAEIIAASPEPDERLRLAREFGTMFKADNPRFDQGRFNKACGVVV